MEKKITSHITKGLLLVAILIGLDFLFQKSPIKPGLALQFLPTLLLIAGVAISAILFANQSGGALKFGDVFAHGFKTTAVITGIMAVYTFLAIKYLYPPPTAAEIEAATKAIQQQGNTMPAEAKQMAEEGAKKMWVIIVPKVIFVSLFSGLVGSAIGAAIAKKNQ